MKQTKTSRLLMASDLQWDAYWRQVRNARLPHNDPDILEICLACDSGVGECEHARDCDGRAAQTNERAANI